MLSREQSNRLRIIAASISLVVGTVLMGVKFYGWHLTGSTAVFSDALESVVNIVAAGFALWVVSIAGRPADRDHPYGHGKLEYFSAVFEGGLITIAAVIILYEGVAAWIRGPSVEQIDLGVMIVFGAGAGNALLGWFLLHMGRKTRSITLTADGHHVLSDFWTSLGVVIGLLLVRFTGIAWLDPLVAIIIGVNLARVGAKLVRRAAGGLLDEEDPELTEQMVEAFNKTAHPGIIRIHHLRAMRAGSEVHVDAHLVVPEYWAVEEAHEVMERFEGMMVQELGVHGEILFHTDPCRRAYCPACDVEDCPVRRAPFEDRKPVTIEEAVRPDPPRTILEPFTGRESSGGE
jgi:cation diffusion facilitator family transporter